MPRTQYSREEIVRRGQELYEQRLRSQVEPQHSGKFLVVDIETGDYEIDRDELAALHRARKRDPEAPLYLLRIGAPATYRLGGRFGTHLPTTSGGRLP